MIHQTSKPFLKEVLINASLWEGVFLVILEETVYSVLCGSTLEGDSETENVASQLLSGTEYCHPIKELNWLTINYQAKFKELVLPLI